jgi:hypothetical protein
MRGLSCCYLSKGRCLLSSVWRTIAGAEVTQTKANGAGRNGSWCRGRAGVNINSRGLPGEACRSQSGGTQLHAGRGWDGCVGKSLSIGTASWVLRYLVMVPWRQTTERENHDGMGVRALVIPRASHRSDVFARAVLLVCCQY